MGDELFEPAPKEAWQQSGWGACHWPTIAWSEKDAINRLLMSARGRSMRWYEKLMRKGARR